MSIPYEDLQRLHPCYSQGSGAKTGRVHLPVSPGCNLRCKFCSPEINHTKQAPAVTSEVLSPKEALNVVRKAVEACPEIRVAGIAGPGDTLVTNFALDTFSQVGKEFPTLVKCMSTNGLLLEDRAQDVIDAGIDTLTVTVNAVDPAIQAQINESVLYKGKRYYGQEAAKLLIEKQLAGIKLVSSAGISVKVNTVLIPGVNSEHIEEIAQAVSKAGAKIYNIIPLIPQAEMENFRAPNCAEIDAARQVAEPYLDVFRHCQHCRADAIGIPGGRDYGDKIYLRRVSAQATTFSHG
jgi:nitrogen fixation protein NifB